MEEQQPAEAAAADAASEAPPPSEAPASESPAPEAPAPEAPAAEEGQLKPEPPTPSKSNLVDKRTSEVSKTQSHVRVVEPGQEGQPAEDTAHKEVERKKSDSEKIKSDAEKRASDAERRKSDAEKRRSANERISRELSSTSHRGSKKMSGAQSKEGILRRRSDRPSKAKAAVGSIISIRRTSGYGESFGGIKLRNVLRETIERAEMCLEQGGMHFENLLQ